MIKQLMLVALGGGVGSVLRYLTTLGISKYYYGIFPLGTFAVNMAGCLIIGLLTGLFLRFNILNNDLRLLLIVGLCGGYTTFSSFSAESIKLLETNHYIIFLFYVTASIVLGLIAVLSGIFFSKIG